MYTRRYACTHNTRTRSKRFTAAARVILYENVRPSVVAYHIVCNKIVMIRSKSVTVFHDIRNNNIITTTTGDEDDGDFDDRRDRNRPRVMVSVRVYTPDVCNTRCILLIIIIIL